VAKGPDLGPGLLGEVHVQVDMYSVPMGRIVQPGRSGRNRRMHGNMNMDDLR